jgi:uracil-DNA glycosylase family 4
VLRWYLEAGVDEAILEKPVDRYRAAPKPVTPAAPSTPAVAAPRPVKPSTASAPQSSALQPPVAPDADAVSNAYARAAEANSLDELRDILANFDGCPLQRTATNLVFGDGASDARIVFIGEAPGAEEDRRGLPFVGPSGRLLDKMLASIQLDRRNVFISNTIFWRPPGNRSPTSTEVATCMPFVERMLELIAPDTLVALGGPAAGALLGQNESVGRLRGRWFSYRPARMHQPVAATVMFHPAYLLRSPAQKRLAWRDLLAIRARINAS